MWFGSKQVKKCLKKVHAQGCCLWLNDNPYNRVRVIRIKVSVAVILQNFVCFCLAAFSSCQSINCPFSYSSEIKEVSNCIVHLEKSHSFPPKASKEWQWPRKTLLLEEISNKSRHLRAVVCLWPFRVRRSYNKMQRENKKRSEWLTGLSELPGAFTVLLLRG